MSVNYERRNEQNIPSPNGKYALWGLSPEKGETGTYTSPFTSNADEGIETQANATQDMGTEARNAVRFTRVTWLRSEMKILREQLRQNQETEESMLGQVLSDKISPYILSKIVEAKTMELRYLNENLTAPYGWIAFGKLLQARMIDVYGEVIVPTEAGIDFLDWFKREQEDELGPEACDE